MLRKEPLEIKEGAILVADSHYANYRPQLKDLLEKIKNGEIQTSQIILLGDNVDLLVAKIKFFEIHEKEIVDLLNDLAEVKEIIYFEGNHDFMIKEIFPKIRVVPLTQQPLYASFKESLGWLAHGDWNGPFSYRLYTALQRNKIARVIYSFFDLVTHSGLSKFLRQKMKTKKLCRNFDNFESYIRRKFTSISLEESWFIEGHYHQGVEFTMGQLRYINLDAMACNKSFFVVQSNDNEIVLDKQIL
ncbi:MAG: hypothetical protein OEW60_01930 [Thiovulaceae bacterium]|nr:hypothetical protein [Sulfurimonadaceae bacterium]